MEIESCIAIVKKTGNACGNPVKVANYCGVHKKLADIPVVVHDPGYYVSANSQNDFVTDKDHLQDTLERFGVAIIRNVLCEEEIVTFRNEVFDFIETVTSRFNVPFDRDDETTWRSFYDLLPLHSMTIQYWSVGHAQASWTLRQNEKIVQIWSELWKRKPEDLLVSFDGMSFAPPHEVTKRGFYRNNKWFHFDQCYNDYDFSSIQSWITAYDVNEGDATLTLIEGSNMLRPYFTHMHNLNGTTDWEKLTDAHIKWFTDRGCIIRDITCKAGDMVFWDSRTAHAGKEALKDRKERNFRSVVYLCYAPRECATETQLKKKREAFDNLRTTTHNPYKIKLFGVTPRLYDNPPPDVEKIVKPTLTSLGKRLAGFKE
tara:strand:- start:2 stop:1117 length:1116 start_codon:yes stop_codon:yes gene_type:complete